MSRARPVRPSLSQSGLSWAGVLLLTLLGACESLGDEEPRSTGPVRIDRPPLPRTDGPRMPGFSGGDPRARGWVRVEDLLWIDARDESAYRRGFVSDGAGYVSFDAVRQSGVDAHGGLRMRTDHLAVHTNASWRRALEVAREAETHVGRLMGAYGDLLDLRLPRGPMKVVVTATRAEFERTMRGLVHDPVGWGAFYDARSGIVYVSLEAARDGALPWRADLRHEITHQVLDLSRPLSRRGRAFPRPWFWLWEGFAIWSEGFGDAAGRDTGAERIARFQRRYAWNDWTPLARLVDLGPAAFEGRHYDQTASFVRYLLDPRVPLRAAAVTDLVRRLLAGELLPGSQLERAAGVGLQELEQHWRATVGQ